MQRWTRAGLVTILALTSTATAGPVVHGPRHGSPWVVLAPAPYAVPYGYPVVPGYGWQPPIPYGAPYTPNPAWYGYDPNYLQRLQPGFRFHEPEGRRGFSIEGYTLPGGR